MLRPAALPSTKPSNDAQPPTSMPTVSFTGGGGNTAAELAGADTAGRAGPIVASAAGAARRRTSANAHCRLDFQPAMKRFLTNIAILIWPRLPTRRALPLIWRTGRARPALNKWEQQAGEDCGGHRRRPEKPELIECPAAHEQRRPGRTRGIGRAVRDGQRNQVDQCDARSDRRRSDDAGHAPPRYEQIDRDERERHRKLERGSGMQAIVERRVVAVPVDAELRGGEIEARPATGDV